MENGRRMSHEIPSSKEAEVAAVFARLRDEIANREPVAPPRPSEQAAAPEGVARSDAERYWAVTADRPFLYKPGRWGRLRGTLLVPAKAVLRKLMRWYVEPPFAQQRDFNARVLRALDELSGRIDMVGEQLAAATDELSAAKDSVEQSAADSDPSTTP